MARKLILEVVGDTSNVERSFRRTSTAASGFERSVGRAARGAAAGSGAFRSMGRSLAFASGGFLAFASAADFIRKSVDAAVEGAVAQKQLAQQLANSGKAFSDYRGQIDKTNLRLGALAGFQNDELNASLTTILRTVPNVSRALKDNALAADLARARHISLAQAALIIANTEAGNTTLLRRQGFQIAKNATSEQALAKLRQVVAGQAAAGTTAQEKFGAVLHDTEEIIGNGLLPTLNRYLTTGTAWLQQMDESGRLQKDVATVSKDVSRAISDGATVFGHAKGAVEDLDRVTGSFENTLKAAAAVWIVFKTRSLLAFVGLTGKIEAVAAAQLGVASTSSVVAGKVAVSTGEMTAGWEAVAAAANGAAAAEGRAAAGAGAGGGGGLLAKGAGVGAGILGAIASAFVIGDIGNETHKTSIVGGRIKAKIGNRTIDLGPAPGAKGSPLNPFAPNRFGNGDLGLGALTKGTGAQSVQASVANAAKQGTSLLGRFNLLQLKLADAERANNTILQRSILVSEEGLLVKLRDQAKTLSKRTDFANQAASVADQIRGIDAANVKQAKKQADKKKKAAANAVGFDVPLALQVAQARAEALGLSGGEKSILQRIKSVAQAAIKSGKLGLEGQLSAWQTIKDVNDQLKNQTTTGSHFAKANVDAIAKGLGLTGTDQIRRARAVLSTIGKGGTVPVHATGAFGVKVPDTVIHTQVNLDGRKIGNSTTKHQQKRARRNPPQKRGPFAGAH